MKFFKDNAIGIYIHYPFCKEICPYCDFNKYLDSKIDAEELFQVYKKELDFFISKISTEKTLYSIYFGGGTPSLMNERLIEKLIDYIYKIFKFKNNFVEITLEANPTSFEIKKFKNFFKSGINRVSLGVQSFNDKELQFLGRKHNVKEVEFAIKNSQEIFEKITFDLIYGLPNQTLENWNFNLQKINNFNVNHVSLYNLTIKEGTPFYFFIKNGRMKEKTEEDMANFIDFTWKTMKQNNFNHYEISNFSKDKISLNKVNKNTNIAIHNMIYWKYFEYIGIGAGACGRIKIDQELYETKIVNSLKKWLSNDDSIELKKLNIKEKVYEILISNLRSKFGINIADILKRFNINILEYLDLKKINNLQEENYLILNKNHLLLKEKGMKFIDYIILEILK